MKRIFNAKTKVLLLLLLAVAGMAKAQTHEFAPVGAEWYYTRYYRIEFYLSGITYDRFRSLRTVEINGWECKEIELFQNLDCKGDVNPYTEIRYITQEGDLVYEVENGERYLLYDFSKEIGESWYAPKYDDTITVVNVSYITLNDGSVRKVMETNNSHWYWLINNIIEGIGIENSLFPVFYTDGAPCMEGPLRCYSEDGVPLIEWSDNECDYEVLAVEEQNETENVLMNTIVKNVLHIDILEKIETKALVEVMDIYGRVMYLAETTNNTLDINMTDKPNGIYLVKLMIDTQEISKKIVKR